ncbi:hypothetical protein FACS189447_09600 [Spirochaetia bacterium]|nr:hypothetical protein FACS189447_09600 [Spirochaetia bacterium]
MIKKPSNFREICMGGISPNKLYRSNHPVYNGKQVSDIIMAANYAKINTVINLVDTVPALKSKIIFCPWYKKLYENNNVITLNISMKFGIMEQTLHEKIRKGVKFMIKHDPPYLLHCEAGIDRTGFLSIILESFMGAKFENMARDYMLSFVGSSEYSTNDYNNGTIFIRNLFSEIKGGLINSDDDLQSLSKSYLLNNIGLRDSELNILANKLGEQKD